MPDLHLSREELTEWRDEAAGDRVRIITHLAACAACRTLAADLERNRPGGSEAPRFDPGDFVARGYRAGTAGGAPRLAAGWTWLAAAAALVAITLVPLWLARLDDRPAVLRGGATVIELVRPVETRVTAEELTFEWKGTSAGDRVRLNVVDLDRPGEPLIEREVTGSRYQPSPEEQRRFRPGQSVHWYVEALGGTGSTSPAARFSVR
jgi:hypothetical protein